MNTARRVLRLLLPQIPLAAAVVIMLGLIAATRDERPVLWLVAAVAGMVVLALPVADYLGSIEPLRVWNLPGYRQPRSLPRPGWVRFSVGVVVAVLALLSWSGPAWAAAALALTAAVGLLVVTGVGVWQIRGRPAERGRVTAALNGYGPKFVVYTARRNDAGYQLGMWLAPLEKLEMRYVVLVRSADAVPVAARLTNAPVVCASTAPDLDCVVVESMKAAFYVNMTAENNSFVLYRSMTHVYLGHGDSDKELSTHPAHAMFDKIFVAGPAARERYPRNGVLIDDRKFVVVGRPQLVAAQPAGQPVREAEPPRVLVAPTWRGYNSKTTLSSLPATPRLVQELIRAGAEVIFRPHPFSWLGRAERRYIESVDQLLRADRDRGGRSHLLATEQRGSDITDVFNVSDAMITDIGSVLVDYFVTGKPYGVVLPVGVDQRSALERYPTLQAAYLIPIEILQTSAASGPGAVLQSLLRDDPLADRRAEVARHYLGDRLGDDRPFLDAVRRVITD